jgi:hypothetical protein
MLMLFVVTSRFNWYLYLDLVNLSLLAVFVLHDHPYLDPSIESSRIVTESKDSSGPGSWDCRAQDLSNPF